MFSTIQSHWNLTGASAAVLLRHLSNSKVIQQFKLTISCFSNSTRSYDMMFCWILKWVHDAWVGVKKQSMIERSIPIVGKLSQSICYSCRKKRKKKKKICYSCRNWEKQQRRDPQLGPAMTKHGRKGLGGRFGIKNNDKKLLKSIEKYISPKLFTIDTLQLTIGHVALVAITGIAIMVPYLWVKSLQLIWRSGTRRWNLRVPDLQMSCRDLTVWQGTKIIAP